GEPLLVRLIDDCGIDRWIRGRKRVEVIVDPHLYAIRIVCGQLTHVFPCFLGSGGPVYVEVPFGTRLIWRIAARHTKTTPRRIDAGAGEIPVSLTVPNFVDEGLVPTAREDVKNAIARILLELLADVLLIEVVGVVGKP